MGIEGRAEKERWEAKLQAAETQKEKLQLEVPQLDRQSGGVAEN